MMARILASANCQGKNLALAGNAVTSCFCKRNVTAQVARHKSFFAYIEADGLQDQRTNFDPFNLE
jgi:hypothetical protein